MDITQFLTKEYIFNAVPPASFSFYIPFMIFFGLLILIGIALWIFVKGDQRKIWKGYITPTILTGFLGLIHLGARYEQLPWLASRFFLILVATTFIAWLIALAMNTTRLIPVYQKEQEITSRYDKYLPKPKKGQSRQK